MDSAIGNMKGTRCLDVRRLVTVVWGWLLGMVAWAMVSSGPAWCASAPGFSGSGLTDRQRMPYGRLQVVFAAAYEVGFGLLGSERVTWRLEGPDPRISDGSGFEDRKSTRLNSSHT